MANNTLNQQVGASEQGVGVSGSSGVTLARDGAVALAQGSALNSGLQFSGGNGSSVTLTDGGIAKASLDSVTKLSESYSQALKDVLSKATDAASSQQTYATKAITDLVESKQTDGVSIWKNPVVILGGLLILVVGWFALKNK